MNNTLYNTLISNIGKTIYNTINENYRDNDLISYKISAEPITSNSEIKKIINNSDFDFMNTQIVHKSSDYLIGGTYGLTWYKFTANDTILGLLAVCPMENMQHDYIEDSEDIIYIACVEISKNAKNILGISNEIKNRKLSDKSYKTVLKNIIEFIEEKYGYDYDKIRLSTESNAEKLKHVYETCGFKVIGKTVWDGYEMEKDI